MALSINARVILNRFKKIIYTHELAGPLTALVILFIVSSILSPHFLTFHNQIVLLLMYVPLATLALGETLIILMGSIDLSPGSVMGLVAVGTAYLIVYMKMPVHYAVIFGILIGLLCGFINGVLVTKAKLPSFVTTLSMLLAARGVIFIVTGGYSITGGDLTRLGVLVRSFYSLPLLVWIFIFLTPIYYFLLKRTTIGLYIYAIGGNEEAVRVSGVNANIVKITAFTLASLFYAISGLFVLGQLQSGYSYIGQGYELNAIASCVLGGISLAGGSGSPLDPLVGAYILTLLQNILILLGINPYYQWVLTAVVLVAAGAALTRGIRYAK
ncbi:MAG: ABC transporter permease [Desulfurococcaceae archaeon]